MKPYQRMIVALAVAVATGVGGYFIGSFKEPEKSIPVTLMLTPVQEPTFSEKLIESKPSFHVIYDEDQVRCLAKNIYHEARNQSDEGMAAIAHVTVNRIHAKGFPNTVCDVVYEMTRRPDGRKVCQFSWTCVRALFIQKPKNKEMWLKSVDIAETVLREDFNNVRTDLTHGALFYHADYVERRALGRVDINPKKIVKIGTHIFYIAENERVSTTARP